MPETKKKSGLSPTRTILISFLLIIAVGTLLLMFPFSARDGHFTPFVDAAFTATTATCVTGLVVVDTFTHWSAFGQGVILALIQIGGLGLVTLTTFFLVALRKKAGLSEMVLAKEAVGGNDLSSLKGLVRLVIIFSFTVELLGAVLLSIRFIPEFGAENGIYLSLFTAVSAFCNAGIDLFGQLEPFSSLTTFVYDPLICLTVAALIIVGGLGFIVYYEVLFVRKRIGRTSLHAKVVLLATGGFLLGGTILFLLMEWWNPDTIGGVQGFGNKLMAAFFQSVTTRTAGFNTVSLSGLTAPSKLLTILLMFIGAAPGSTGGGMKITTAVVIAATVLSTARGSDEVTVLKRRIDRRVVYKAFSLVLIGLLTTMATTAVLYVSESVSLMDASFESFSAIGTVGLSTGITPSLHLASKLALIITMFLGRVGPFTFFIALTRKKQKSTSVVLPEGQIFVG